MAGLKVEITGRTGETNDILSFLDPKYEALEPQHAKFITELFDLVNHSTNDFEWDPKSERNNHAPFIKLLNKITSGSAPNREKNASGPRLFFSACDRATEDSVGSEEKLKPDGVGHFASKSLTKDKSIPWRDIRVAVEVKNEWLKMLLQAATYGRAMMSKRICPLSFTLLFNHADFSVRVVCFTRPVNVTSQELFLKNELEFQMFVRAVWTIASLVKENADLERYATTIDGHDYFALPANDGSHTWWRTTEQLAERTTINGRATRVYVIECVAIPSQEKQDTGGQQIETEPETSGRMLRSQSKLKTDSVTAKDEATLRTLEDWFRSFPYASDKIAPENALPPTAMDPTRKYILKDSYAVKGREDTELAMFSDLAGQHGVADIIGGFTVPHTVLGNLNHIQDLRPSGLLPPPRQASDEDEDKEKLHFDRTVHRRLICATRGLSLHDNKVISPPAIVYIAMDSMIAVFNAYILGWLHRDLTVTNITAREEPQARTPEMIQSNACFGKNGFEFLDRHLKLCLGALIDGDLAVKWEEVRKPTRRRSGTKPFISIRLLETIGKEVVQTPLDDIESIVWTVVWVGTLQEEATPEECLWREVLDHRTTRYAVGERRNILHYFQDWPGKEDTMSRWFQKILPLLRQWLELMLEAQRAIDRLLVGKQKPAPPVGSLNLKGLLGGRHSAGSSKTGQTRHDFRSLEKAAEESLPKSGGVVDIDGDKLDSLIHEYMKKYLKAGVDWLEKNNIYDELKI